MPLECISGWIKLWADRLDNSKRITVSAPPLPWKAVLVLELCTINHHDASTRVGAGFLLFMIYAKLRCADATRITEEPALDPTKSKHGFLEVTATKGKCAQSAKKRRLGRKENHYTTTGFDVLTRTPHKTLRKKATQHARHFLGCCLKNHADTATSVWNR